MKLSEVLIKPILTEKANSQQEKLRRYAFKVARKANKLEIKKSGGEFLRCFRHCGEYLCGARQA